MKFVVAAFFSLLLAQTPPPAAPAILSGRVVDSLSGQPLADAAIELVRVATTAPASAGGRSTPAPPPQRTRTSDDGRFELTNIPPGDYRLYGTTDNGYVPSENGQRTPTGVGTAVTLASGQNVSNITLRLTPTATVSGRVTDGDGDPSVFTSMLAFRIVYSTGGARKIEIVQSVLTDDHGEYRLYWLAPGKYYVSALPIETRSYGLPLSFASRFGGATYWATPMLGYRALDNGDLVEETWAPVYYPGTTDILAAKPIQLHAGEQFHTDFNIANSPTRTLLLQGDITDPAGQALGNATLTLTPQKPEGHSVVLPQAMSNDKGKFLMHGVTPGSYFLFVVGGRDSFPTGGLPPGANVPLSMNASTAFIPLEVSKSGVDSMNIATVPAIDIPLHLEFQIRTAGTISPRIRLVRDPDIAGAPDVSAGQRVSAQGILVTGVGAGNYRIDVSGLPKNAYVKSMRSGALDVLKDGLHINGESPQEISIVLADDGGTLDGSGLDDRKQPVAGAVVVLMPNDPALRPHRIDLFKSTTCDAAGRFHFDGIAPGDYKVFAWDDIRSGDWFDPGLMRAFEYRGVPILIGSTESKMIEVPVNASEDVRP